MPARHACPLCDYSRAADHVTLLDPRCPNCGGLLRTASATVVAPVREVRSAGARRLERALLAVVLVPVLAAAAKIGWTTAGPAAAAGMLVFAALAAYVALAPATRHH